MMTMWTFKEFKVKMMELTQEKV